MPLPLEIRQSGDASYNCGNYYIGISNPKRQQGERATIYKNFKAYLELEMQSKHDQWVSGYCHSLQLSPRKQDGSQITHKKNATKQDVLDGFYNEKGRTASDVVVDIMKEKWSKPTQSGESEFEQGKRYDAAVQKKKQSDNYRYEISYWYDVKDIYVLFHCYP